MKLFRNHETGVVSVIKRYDVRDDHARRAFLKETSVLMNIRHPNVVRLEGMFFASEDESVIIVQLPYLGPLNLREWLREKERSDDDIHTTFFGILQVYESHIQVPVFYFFYLAS